VDAVNYEYQIFKANVTGAGPEIQITNCTCGGNCGCEDASWSPDGTELVLSYYDGSNYQVATVSSTAVNGAPTVLTSDALDHTLPYWSPDGTKIVFEHDMLGPGQIGVYNLTGPSPPVFNIPEFSSITLLLAALVALGGVFAFRRYR
jgi:Tol biopolymer transport system component